MLGASASRLPPEQILNSLPHFIWTARPDGFTDYVNQGGLEYLGVDSEALKGWGWLRSVHPADVSRSLETWTEATATGNRYDVEYRIRTASGEYRWQYARGEAIRQPDGTIVGWVGSTIEIERWKQHEHHLRSANRQIDETVTVLSLLENHSPVGFALVDTNFRFIRVNDTLAEMNGRARSEHLGQSVESLMPQLWNKLRPAYEAVLQTQEPVLNCEVVAETHDSPGEQRHWLLSYHPVVLEDELLAVGIIVREITAQKQVEQQLQVLLGSRSGD